MSYTLKKVEEFLKKNELIRPNRTLSNITDLLYAVTEDDRKTYVAFDAESICNHDDYEIILLKFQRACNRINQFEIISSYFDAKLRRAGIHIRVNGTEIKGDWDQMDDWVSDQFISIIQQAENNINGKFVDLNVDQTFRAFYFESELLAKELSGLFDKLLVEEEW